MESETGAKTPSKVPRVRFGDFPELVAPASDTIEILFPVNMSS
jgi:hypothetical protein